MSALLDQLDIPDLADAATFEPGVPHGAFDRLRAAPGIVWHPATSGTLTGGFWVLTRYDDVAEVLANAEMFRSNPGPVFPLPNPSGDGPMSKHILFMDPPEHGRVRRAAAKSFGPRTVANFHDWVQEVVVETLDEALPMGEFDWVNEIARLIPSRVIANVMGVPREQRHLIIEGAEDIFVGQTADDGGVKHAQAYERVTAFMVGLGQTKLKHPQDDMITVLAQALDSGDIDQVEFMLYTASLVVAGYETTHTMIGHIANLLASDADIARLTSEAIESGRTAELVDEFIRFVTPAMTFVRTAATDTTFRGQAIAKNDMMFMSFSAANRDPSAFEDPHRFNPFREGARPAVGTGGAGLAFSAGPHRCVGHVLAKLELRLLLEEMHRRGVTLEPAGTPVRGASVLVNQMMKLPVKATTK